jgi:hypothetical protein
VFNRFPAIFDDEPTHRAFRYRFKRRAAYSIYVDPSSNTKSRLWMMEFIELAALHYPYPSVHGSAILASILQAREIYAASSFHRCTASSWPCRTSAAAHWFAAGRRLMTMIALAGRLLR